MKKLNPVKLGKEISIPLLRKMFTEDIKRNMQVLSKKCLKHPKYKAIRKPSCDCEVCLGIYEINRTRI